MTRPTLTTLSALAVAAVAACGIALVQPGLARDTHGVRQRDDVFLLPPPAELRVMALGYDNAVTDLLWAKLVLEYGLHGQEKRPFPDAPRYIDGILALEPDFPTLYRFVDTLLVYAPGGNTEDNARRARAYLERGTRERPYDSEVWLHYGQFIAFLAPSFLHDENEIEAWRKDGALALARAVELGEDADRSLAASTILSKAGERDAAIEHLQRAYAMTDDPDARQQILYKLQRLKATSEAERAVSVVEREWRTHYGFVSRGAALLMGPHRDPAACAGPHADSQPDCPSDWTAAVDATR